MCEWLSTSAVVRGGGKPKHVMGWFKGAVHLEMHLDRFRSVTIGAFRTKSPCLTSRRISSYWAFWEHRSEARRACVGALGAPDSRFQIPFHWRGSSPARRSECMTTSHASLCPRTGGYLADILLVGRRLHAGRAGRSDRRTLLASISRLPKSPGRASIRCGVVGFVNHIPDRINCPKAEIHMIFVGQAIMMISCVVGDQRLWLLSRMDVRSSHILD